MKKVICFVILVCMLISIIPCYAVTGFEKASDWAVDDLKKAEEYGLIPDSIKSDMSRAITRKEFAEVCVRLYELTTNSTAEMAPVSTFSDTQHIDVLKAFKLGIVTGIGDNKFGPDLTTNREQIATMLKRLLYVITPDFHTFKSVNTFSDRGEISSWALESVDLASQYEFVTGWNNLFAPKGECTREMAVIIAKRVYDFYSLEVPLEEQLFQTNDILRIAEKYYQKTIAGVEKKDEFSRVINFTPDFSGSKTDAEKARLLSADAVHLITYTNARNMYVSFSAAVFSLNPQSAVCANNLASAIAVYNDEMIASGKATEEAYQDAIQVYMYALQKSKKDGNFTADSLNILVSLGNLYLDTNRFQQANAAFRTAYEIDAGCSSAKIGLMNYNLAKGDRTAASKYENGLNYPLIAQEVFNFEKELPEIMRQPALDASASEGKLEDMIIKNSSVPVISVWDFFRTIAPKNYNNVKLVLNDTIGKMQLKTPELTIITQYSGLQSISSPAGQYALSSYFTGLTALKSQLAQVSPKVGSTQPELAIFDCNPYEYSNYMDVLVQRYNVSALQRKMSVLPYYADKLNTRITKQIEEKKEALSEQLEGISRAESFELESLEKNLEKQDVSEEAKTIMYHKVHEKYREQRNGVRNIAYNEITSLANEAYLKKIKPYAERVYNDSIGHIMLISDAEVQESLENRLQEQVLNALYNALDNVLQAHKITKWEEQFEQCKCHLPEMEEERKRRAAEEEDAAKNRLQNDISARKSFTVTDISEHIQLYRNKLSQLQSEIKTIAFNGSISPAKSSWSINLGLKKDGGDEGIHFGNLSAYYRNTATYHGGFTITAKEASPNLEGKLVSFVNSCIVTGSVPAFSPVDIDVYYNRTINRQAAIIDTTDLVDVFASRGTKFHDKAVITGNDDWDEYKLGILKKWPDIKLKTWDGRY